MDGIVGLFKIWASPLEAFQSAFTLTSAPDAIPSSLVLSAALMLPAAEVVAAVIEIAGVDPPEDTIGEVPLTLETPEEGAAPHSGIPPDDTFRICPVVPMGSLSPVVAPR